MKFRVLSYLGVCIANIVLSFLLSPYFGAIGAAFGTVLSLVIGNILIMNLYYHKKIGLNMKRAYRETFRGILPVILLVFVASWIVDAFIPLSGWTGVIVKGLVVCAFYLPCAWFIGMNSYEKNILLSPLKHIVKRSKEG